MLQPAVRTSRGTGACLSCPKKILPCDVNGAGELILAAVRITRHRLNDRHYASLERLYSNKLRDDGYDNEDAGAIHLMAVDMTNTTWWALGGGTRCSAVILTAKEDPENGHLKTFIRGGGFKAVCYKSTMPDFIVQHLVEELNSKNTLGAANTLMQRICSVPRYIQLHARQVAIDGDECQEQWEFIKAQTSLYESEVTWKKAVVLYNSLTSNCSSMDGQYGGQSVLTVISTYFANHVDVLASQAQDKQRNMLKYFCDVAAKVNYT